MDSFQVYKDMKARTNGEIYIGVVGPVRTGKSTFIRRFAELLILPNLKEEHVKQRTQDELPQAASGTTIMTTEPKFVPKEAADVKLSDDIEVKIRLADCVGFMVDGANGHTENGQERQVIYKGSRDRNTKGDTRSCDDWICCDYRWKCDRSAKRKLCGSRRADSERTSTDWEAISYFIKLPETVFERDRTFEISS